MLTPEYLAAVPGAMVELYSEAERAILADMARRISTYDYWIPAAEWQAQKLVEAGALQDDILKTLSGMTGRTTKELRQLMKDAGVEALRADTLIYEAQGLAVPAFTKSAALNGILNAGLKATLGELKNLTGTTAKTATRQFEDALDRAWMKISSGAFDTDAAVRGAIKELSAQGVGAIRYPTGHVDTLEVAVRRATVTGVNQTAAMLQEELADELGCDLVEVTAHAGARPEHALWQGQVYSRSGKTPGYKDFRAATGYGTGAGLCGWNCRHSFNPYFEGSPRAYSDELLESYDAKTIEYNGQKMTEYEALQQQRYMERQIRRWKRENAAMQAAGLDTTESAAKIKQWQDAQMDFLRQTGLSRQGGRESIAGWGRSQASKATYDAKILKMMQDDAIMKAKSGLPKKVFLPDTTIKETVERYFPGIDALVPKGATAIGVYAMAGEGTSNSIDDWKRLYNLYGGDPRKYQKLSGDVVTGKFRYIVHWYECNGNQDSYKITNVKVV